LIDLDTQRAKSPISNAFATYVKPDIISYSQNLETAKDFMRKAGYDPSTLTNPGYTTFMTIASLFLMGIIVHLVRRRKQK
jgi:hypothetical protein